MTTKGMLARRVRRIGLPLLVLVLLLPAPSAHGDVGPAGPNRPNSWAPTGEMRLPPSDTLSTSAVLLRGGKVLVLGAFGGYAFDGHESRFRGQVYDPHTGRWTVATGLSADRSRYMPSASAVLLRSGKVLVAGGEYLYGIGASCPTDAHATGTAVYGPERADLSAASSAAVQSGLGGRVAYPHAAPLGPPPPAVPMCSADLYDPRTDTWSATGDMTIGRFGNTATLLLNGKVLVTGGTTFCDYGGCTDTASAELYDPRTGHWTPTGSMHRARGGHSAIRLADGRVLIMGPGAELYDPRTGRWTGARSMPTPRSAYTQTLLPDGRVLVAGGTDADNLPTTSAQLYDPRTGRWTPTGSMRQARAGHSATLLRNGLVLVAGGTTSCDDGGCTVTASAELYDPRTGTWSLAPAMATPRSGHLAILLASGRVLVTGAWEDQRGQPTTRAELYTPGPRPRIGLSPSSVDFGSRPVGAGSTTRAIMLTNISTTTVTIGGVAGTTRDFTASSACAGVMLAPRATCTITLRFAPSARGPRRAVLSVGDAVGGARESVLVGLAGFGIAPRTWVPTARMLVPRTHHTATLLPDGRVLVAGGDNEDVLGGSLASVSAELYDPRTGTWTATGSMHTPRECHTATLLPDGKVLVAGGGDSECQGPLTSAELYDPATDRWTATGSMGAGRLFHTATLLRNGKVLVAGGCDDPNCLTALASAELYDPATDRWTATGSMSAARGEHTATLLPNGKVLVAGGREPDIRSSSELYDPATGTWTATGNMKAPRYSYTATLLPDGKVLAAGGGSDNAACDSSPVCYAPTNSAELYDPATGTWAATGSMSSIRGYHTATLLPTNGRVLVTGGSDSGPGRALSSTELYDSVTGRWRPGARMLAARDEHTATLLSDGTLLVAGGEDNGYGIVAPMAELYMTR